MNGIFPQYVGPSVTYRHNSLYPVWVYPLDDTIVPGQPHITGQSEFTGDKIETDDDDVILAGMTIIINEYFF